jgi:glycosyltransferase involved in cell wall biosynthesis
MESDFLTVSVIVPCRNEKDHIDSCIRSILSQEISHGQMELIVVDGMSNDGTRAILHQLMGEDSRLKVLDNLRKITPCARNIGIRAAIGNYIAILDAHTVYASGYLGTCIALLEEHPEICCAGGPIISVGKSVFGRATAAAMSHPLGVGNAKHRFPKYEGYAEGACFPVFRREIFEKVGLFDENLVRNQDDEFNFRVALSGEKIFLSPRAQCTYYVRESFKQLFWQFFQYGYYRVVVLRKHRLPISLRHFVPIIFFSLVCALSLGCLWFSGWWNLIAISLPMIYVLTLIIAGISLRGKQGRLVGLVFPFAAATIHFAYAVGFAWAFFKGASFRTGVV